MKSVWLSGMEETDWQWAASSPLPPIHQRRNNNPSSMQHKYKYKINTNTKTMTCLLSSATKKREKNSSLRKWTCQYYRRGRTAGEPETGDEII